MKIKIVTILSVVTLLLFLGSCAKKVTFERSSVVPAAEAEVTVKKDKNGNYELGISVQNLAHPKNLSPSRETYVVWMQSNDYNTYNLGEIQIANNLKGSLTAVTPHKPEKITITAEDTANKEYPGGQVILTADRF